jgi:hypothetical protein
MEPGCSLPFAIDQTAVALISGAGPVSARRRRGLGDAVGLQLAHPGARQSYAVPRISRPSRRSRHPDPRPRPCWDGARRHRRLESSGRSRALMGRRRSAVESTPARERRIHCRASRVPSLGADPAKARAAADPRRRPAVMAASSAASAQPGDGAGPDRPPCRRRGRLVTDSLRRSRCDPARAEGTPGPYHPPLPPLPLARPR